MNDQQPQWTRQMREVPDYVQYAHRYGRGMLLLEQIEELVKSINPQYVDAVRGNSYLAHHQARAEMNRIFGYGNWDLTTDAVTLLYETFGPTGNDKKERWLVAYRAKVTVDIRDLWGMPIASYTGTHAEENAPQPNRGEAHALALTSVDSYAMRRALINLGDRFGLGLYDGGKTQQHGRYTIQLQDKVLFDWVPTGAPAPQPQGAQQAPATAEAAIAAMQGAPQQDFALQQPPVQRPPVDERFPQAFSQVQEANAAARQQAAQGGYPAPPQQEQAINIPAGANDALLQRMQAQMKVDEGQAAPMQGDVTGMSRQADPNG